MLLSEELLCRGRICPALCCIVLLIGLDCRPAAVSVSSRVDPIIIISHDGSTCVCPQIGTLSSLLVNAVHDSS